MLCAQNLVGGQQQLSSVSVRFNQGLSNQVQWWALFKLAGQMALLASEKNFFGKVQRADFTCDVIRNVAPFVLSKL